VTVKSITAKKIYSFCFLGLMAFFGIVSVFSLVKNHLPNNKSEKTSAVDTTETVSFSEQYPFEEDETATIQEKQIDLSVVEKYRNFVLGITDRTSDYFTGNNLFFSKFNSLQNIYSDYTYGGLVLNGSDSFVKLPNGYLAGCFDYCPSTKSLNNILDFSKWLEGMEIPYLTLITPDKSDDSITNFSKGIPHGYTKTLNDYKSFLEKYELKYIELKPILLAKNDNFYSWFYKSDHHWNVRAAYTTAQETAKFLNEELSILADTSVLDDDNFELRVYPKSFIGSYGKKLGDSWKEDIEVLYPKKKTDFHIEISKNGLEKTGDFKDTLIDQSLLKSDESSYCAFLYGDFPLVRIENNNCQNGTRVLVIKLSFANAFCPYLANSVQNLDMIDPRYFDGSIRSYIKQTNPDAVILCMGAVTEYDEEYLKLK